MPKARDVCAAPGCPNPAAPGRRGRCRDHSRSRRGQRQQRELALADTAGRCSSCGAPAAVAHHRRRAIDGGSDELDNLVPLCRACHDRLHPHPRRLRPLA
jgi:5-methylcytosine-specific restriction endonuclease McrA